MKIEVLSILNDGSGSMVVYEDDGSSFNQQFYGAPIDDSDECLKFLTKVAATVIAMRPPPQNIIAQSVQLLVNQKVDAVASVVDEVLGTPAIIVKP